MSNGKLDREKDSDKEKDLLDQNDKIERLEKENSQHVETIKQLQDVHIQDEAEKKDLKDKLDVKCRQCDMLEVDLAHARAINKVHEGYRESWERKNEFKMIASDSTLKDNAEEIGKSHHKEASIVSCIKEELFHFIHPSVEDEEALSIHRQVKRLVTCHGIQEICKYLPELAKAKKILLPESPLSAYKELVRMGMPEKDGFNEKTFHKYYVR